MNGASQTQPNAQLLSYITEQMRKGETREAITKRLIDNGWNPMMVHEGFESLGNVGAQPATASAPAASSSQAQPWPGQPVAAQTPTQQPQAAQPRARRRILPLIIILVLVLLLAGSAYAYYVYQSPAMVMKRLPQKLNEVKTLEYTGTISLEISEDAVPLPPTKLSGKNLRRTILGSATRRAQALEAEPELLTTTPVQTYKLETSIAGSLDATNKTKPRSSATINLKLPQILPLTSFDFEVETRSIDKIFYFMFPQIPAFGTFDLRDYAKQWFSVDPKAYGQELGQTSNELTADQISKIEQAFERHQVFTISQVLKSEKVNGVNTHHYKFALNGTELKNLLKEINQIVYPQDAASREDFYTDDMFANLPEGELWVGKKDSLPYRLTLTTKDDKLASFTFNTAFEFKNYDKPVVIETPANARPFEEVMAEIETLYQDSLIEDDGTTDTDSDGLTDVEEADFGTNPENPDSDADNFTDGEEVDNGYDPLGPGRLEFF